MSGNARKLEGKVAVVTGGSQGIGAAIAKRFAAEGAAVAVNYYSNTEAANRVVEEIARSGGRAIPVQANITKRDDIQRLFAEANKALARLDVLVNNAGVSQFAPLEEITEENFHKQFDINALSVLLTTQEAVKYFGPDGGSVINISSSASAAAPANASVYSASKAAVDAITKSLAKELGPRKIRVNAINPGMVATEGVRAAGFLESDFRKWFESQAPLRRIGQPDDIAHAAVFLASSDADWITGETLFVSGGFR